MTDQNTRANTKKRAREDAPEKETDGEFKFENEEDDEETLLEQEEAERLSGYDKAKELDDLAAEAETPLEDLLPPGYVSIAAQVNSALGHRKKRKDKKKKKKAKIAEGGDVSNGVAPSTDNGKEEPKPSDTPMPDTDNGKTEGAAASSAAAAPAGDAPAADSPTSA